MDNTYDYWGPLNICALPEPYTTYAVIRESQNNAFFRSFSKVEIKGSEKWVILCLATLNSDERETDAEEPIAFIMNMENKTIKKEDLSKLKLIKGTISAELKREANSALDGLNDWIMKNESLTAKKRERTDEVTAISGTVLKKRSI